LADHSLVDDDGPVKQTGPQMRILFVADLHYQLKQFDWLMTQAPEFDVVIIGGDLLELASMVELDVQIVVIEKYLQRLSQQKRLLVSSGNHDGDARSAANESICKWLHEMKAAQLFVDGDSVELDEVLFTICPWWDGPVSRAELETLLAADAARSKKRWVWIHHSPPDQSPVSWAGKKFGGDEFLVEWIQRYQPDLVLSGHIHNAPFSAKGSWIDRLGKTWVFNPGKQIGPCPACLIFDLDKLTVVWTSLADQVVRQLDAPGDVLVKGTVDEAGGA
jgi:Icc-related predicted phosphoesterase